MAATETSRAGERVAGMLRDARAGLDDAEMAASRGDLRRALWLVGEHSDRIVRVEYVLTVAVCVAMGEEEG